jgi:hypothetical protein
MQEITEQTCLYDLDGTLANHHDEMKKELLKLQSPNDPEIDFDNLYGLYSGNPPCPDWLKNRMHLIKNYPGWWLNLPKLKDGFEILELTQEIGFTTHILSKGPAKAPAGWTEKLLWCQQNIPMVNVVKNNKTIKHHAKVTLTMDKELIYGKVLVEDWPPYIEKWLKWRKRGLSVILDRPYNKDFEHPQVVRYDGTPESLEIVKEKLKISYER